VLHSVRVVYCVLYRYNSCFSYYVMFLNLVFYVVLVQQLFPVLRHVLESCILCCAGIHILQVTRVVFSVMQCFLNRGVFCLAQVQESRYYSSTSFAEEV